MAEVNKETKQTFLDLFLHPSLDERFFSIWETGVREQLEHLEDSYCEKLFGDGYHFLGKNLSIIIWMKTYMPDEVQAKHQLNEFIDEIVLAIENQKEKSENVLFKHIFRGKNETSKS